MRNEAKTSHTTSSSSSSSSNSNSNVGRGFRARMEHYIYSGEKKHVMVGFAIIAVVFSAPWFLMSRGSKHQSHQDYLEKADKARSQRLSSAK